MENNAKDTRYTRNAHELNDHTNMPLLSRISDRPAVHVSSRINDIPLANLGEADELEPSAGDRTDNHGIDDGLVDDGDVELVAQNPPLRPANGGNRPAGRHPEYPNEKPTYPGQPNAPPPNYGPFPYAPGFGPTYMDAEPGYLPSGEKIPDVNIYQHKKTLAQGMMDLALFSANANQLRYVVESYAAHPYYYPNLLLISISLIMQIAVGAGLIWNSRYNVKDQQEICVANRINNFTVIGIFIVTVVNVFISAFGVAKQ